MKPIITWILVVDGAHARFLEHAGPGKGLREMPELEISVARLKGADIVSDKPGRTATSSGSRRNAMQPTTNPVEKREADFVHDVANILENQFRDHAFQRLIVAAAPRALGEMRKSLSSAVAGAVSAELAKDLVNIPIGDLEAHLKGVLAV